MKKKVFLSASVIFVFLIVFNIYIKSDKKIIDLKNVVAKTNIQRNFDNGGIRYAQDGASYSGAKVSCGDTVRIKECYEENGIQLCAVDKINSRSVNAVVKRMKLSSSQEMICQINGDRYVTQDAYESGDKVSCGDIVHVTTCYYEGNVGYCDYNKVKRSGSNSFESASGVVKRMKLSDSNDFSCGVTAYFHESSDNYKGYGLDCGKTTYHENGVCKSSGDAGSLLNLPNTASLTSGDKKFIGWAFDDDGKNVNCSGELVTSSGVKINSDTHYYACYEDEQKCENSEKISNGKGPYQIKVCYETYSNSANEMKVRPISDDFDDILTCAKGYTMDAVSKTNIIETTCSKVGNCHRVYEISCVGDRPKIKSSVSIVQNNGEGIVEFTGISNSGIKGYYASRNYLKPTKKTEWINDPRGTYSFSATPGSLFLWVIDNEDVISYAVMTSVIDKINVDTTLKQLNIKDEDGENLNSSVYSFDNSLNGGIVSSDYVRLSNGLKNNNPVLANGFNPFDTAYKVTTKSSKISVYATLTSSDASYVEGYEPRTVELDYGVNTILIKIINKKGKERTYTIIATREDDRDAINYLKDLNVSEGKLEFSQYTTDYVVSVGKNKKSVTINAELFNDKAIFVSGFEPRTVNLDSDETTVAIKVKSETGAVRVYNISFVKGGENTTDKDVAMLSSLSLSESYVAFSKNVSDYNTFVDYEIDSTNIYAIAENGGDSVSIYKTIDGDIKKIDSKDVLLDVGNNNITIIVSTPDGYSKTWTINIIRKENGLDVSSDTALSYLGVDGYDIDFTPEKLDYEIKIKDEKTLVIAAAPVNNRSEIYIRGNDNLTAFSIVKIRVIAEDGQFREYTIDIKKDTVNKTIEMIAIIGGVVIIICGIIIIRVRKKRKMIDNYYA